MKDKIPHSAGKKIHQKEDASKIVIRWAITEGPAAIEEELHRRHKKKFKKPPEYVKLT